MNKFDDFSKFKLNELSTYLLNKQVKRLLIERINPKKFASFPFAAPIFSALILIGLWIANEFNSTINQLGYKILLMIFIPISLVISYTLLIFIYIYFFNPCIMSILNYFEERRLRKEIISAENSLTLEKSSLLEKFNKEIVNQISVAFSLSQNIEEDRAQVEKDFYGHESLRYIESALRSLQIIIGKLKDEIKDPKSDTLRKSRIQNSIEISKKVILIIEENLNFTEDDDMLLLEKLKALVELITNEIKETNS